MNVGAGRLDEVLQKIAKEKPILAVCGGMILAGSIPGKACEGRNLLGLIHGKIDNNELDGEYPIILHGKKTNAVFSDGPVISDLSDTAEVIATLADDNRIIAVRDKNVFVTAVHENGVHEFFLKNIIGV